MPLSINDDHVMVSLCDGILNRFDPLGARCIMGVVEQQGGQFRALFQDRLISREKIIKQISELNPFAVWISVHPETLGVLKFLKTLSVTYDGPIIIGNVGSRGLSTEELKTLRSNVVVVLGQGEDATSQIHTLLKKNRILEETELNNIKNLRYFSFDRNHLVETELSFSMLAKQTIPSSLEIDKAIERNDVITTRSSSGCNFSCVFCTVKDINNRQKWMNHNENILKKHLEMIVNNGMKEGMVRLVDDDLAGDITNVLAVAKTFNEVNKELNANIKFGFATRASHFANAADTEEQAQTRIQIWKYAVSVGLDTVFLGLESGSNSQLKRLGKSISAKDNYKAVSIAKSLNIDLEIGFIPVDPFMNDETWRNEMRDNISLARYIDAAKTSPTWLAPMRAYEGSPIATWLRNHALLCERIENTDEYRYKYHSPEVTNFLEKLGPAFCEGKTNGLYDLKREIKNVQRYPYGLDKKIQHNCDAIINAEIEFVEKLLDVDLNGLDVQKNQIHYIEVLEKNIEDIVKQISSFGEKRFIAKILFCCKEAIKIIQSWKNRINMSYAFQ